MKLVHHTAFSAHRDCVVVHGFPCPQPPSGPHSQGYSAAISLPKKRQGHGCAALSDGRVFVCGGRNGKSIYSDAYLISPLDNTCTQVSDSPCLTVRTFSRLSRVTPASSFSLFSSRYLVQNQEVLGWDVCFIAHKVLFCKKCQPAEKLARLCVEVCCSLTPPACDSNVS